MRDKILESAASAIIVLIITFVFSSTIQYITGDKGIVRLSDAIEIEKGKYQVITDIINFSDKSFDKIKIQVPQDIALDQVKSNQPIKINKLSNNLGNNSGSVFEIERVAENEKLHISILFNKEIDVNKIKIEKNNNPIKIEYINNSTIPLRSEILPSIIMAILYAIVTGAMTYIQLVKKEQINRKVEKLEKQLDKIELEGKEKYNSYNKKFLILMSRLRDYSKELNFWKDTIRKIIYQSKDKNINAEVVINSVTKSLKTYQTKTDEIDNFESINILAKMLKYESKTEK